MRDIGFVLFALGAGSLILRAFGRHPMVMSVFGPHERTAAIAFLVVGAVVFAVGFRKKKAVPSPSPGAPAGAAPPSGAKDGPGKSP